MRYKKTVSVDVPINTFVTVDIDLEEIDTDDLVEELESRGLIVNSDHNDQLKRIYELRRLGKPFDSELDNYIYDVLCKVV